MQKYLPALGAILLVMLVGVAHAQQGDARIVQAREALRAGESETLERLARARETHSLDHYVRYWWLIDRLSNPDDRPHAQVREFIREHADSVPGERLATYWLRRLARDEAWPEYLEVYREHEPVDVRLQCLAWRARYATGDDAVLGHVAEQWSGLDHSPAECTLVLQAATVSGHIEEEAFWQRFRREIDSRSPQAARATFSWHASADSHRGEVAALLNNPRDYLDRLPSGFARTRTGRELALAALVRLTRHEDASAGHARFTRLRERFSEAERQYMYGVLGHHGALSRIPEAVQWYRQADTTLMTPTQREWRVRAALRAENWGEVETAIAQLQPETQREAEWVYWQARAHEHFGREAAAQRLYRSIAGEPHYYSMLAAESLGQLFQPPPPDEPVSAEAMQQARSHPGLQRALLFYQLDMPTEGVREWLHAVRGGEHGFLLAAARLALEHQLYDRAINTAERADPNAHFELRFLTPFIELVEPHALEQQLRLDWVYGLMRQESRFVGAARSHAGARGLMQVMPATGKWVAQRLGLKNYSPHMLNDPQTNVMLGTGYMRLIMGDLDDNPVLASAGYNAGPGRAQRWRGERVIDGDIYTATIPINETRDYVEKVLANKVIYAAMMEGRPQSLRERLQPIYPRIRK